MKKFCTRRITKRYAFTLVELLVVIAIIAILAAATMSVGNMVINSARKAKAANTATQIQTATLSYYTEYSVYPTPSGAGTGDWELTDKDTSFGGGAGAATWGTLIECLSGMISPATGTSAAAGTLTENVFSNSRQIAFLNLKASDVATAASGHQDAPVNPLPYNTANPYFNIGVDTGYSGILGTGDTSNGSANWLPTFSGTGTTTFSFTTGGGTSTAGVAVWANCSPTGSTSQANWCVHTF